MSTPAGRQFLKCYARHPNNLSVVGFSYTVQTSFTSGLCGSDFGESNNVQVRVLTSARDQSHTHRQPCPLSTFR